MTQTCVPHFHSSGLGRNGRSRLELSLASASSDTCAQVMAAIGAVNPLILLCKLDGKQMISLLIGTGGALASNFGGGGELGFDGFGWKYGLHTRRLVTFSLDGKAVVPEQPAPQLAKPIFDKEFKVDEARAAAGGGTYAVHLCVSCHGGGAVAGVRAPDLRESPHLLHGSTSRSRTSSVAEIFSKRVWLDSQP